MSGGPWRELFVELPMAILEAAVLQRQPQPQDQPAALPVTPVRPTMDDCVRLLTTRYGFRKIKTWRSERGALMVISAEYKCGHRTRYEISDQAFCAAHDLVAAVDLSVDTTSYGCFCVLPWW